METNHKGFSLIEALVVIGVVVLLVAIIIVVYLNGLSRNRDFERLTEIRGLQTALEYYHAGQNAYPAATNLVLGGANAKCLSQGAGFAAACSGEPYMKDVPQNPNPNGSPYVYTSTDNDNYTISFTLEGQTGSVAGGKHVADPLGIK